MIFDILALAFVALFSFIMMKRGGIKAILSFCSLLLSVVIAVCIYSPITEAVYSTSLPENVEETVKEVLMEKIESEGGINVESIPVFIRDAIDLDEDTISVNTINAVSEQIARMVISVIVFLIVVIVSKIVLAIIIRALDLAAKLPVISQLNSILGLGFGIVISLVIVWIASMVAGAVSASDMAVAKFVDGSVVVNIMSNITPF